MSKKIQFSATNDTSLRNKVYKYIKAQILTGEYSPGDTLIESKLAEELGVSRTPIREAIRLLELEGLLEATAKKGATVLGISHKDVEDIYAIRQLIEGLAARWAAERLDEDDLKEMRKIFDLMEFYANKNEVEEVAALDRKFHQIIYDASGSKMLKLTLGNLYQFVQMARMDSLKGHNRLPHTIEEHRAVLNAFLARDPDIAEKALSNHIKMAYENIVSRGS
jgi:DNA-binding GntR family transcriptional regulator